MSRHSILTILFIAVIGAVVAGVGGYALIFSESDSMKFIVQIPENTPNGDHVFFFSTLDQRGIEMQEVAPYYYSLTLSAEEFGLNPGDEIRYRYTRNRAHFAEAEYIAGTPEVNDYFFDTGAYEGKGVGRSVEFDHGKIQQDSIDRWRWFPEGQIALEDISELLPQGDFLPRVGDIRFRSGQGIWDLYTPEYDPFNVPTAKRMKMIGYEWVTIYPPWQWIAEDPLPKAGDINAVASSPMPNYTDDQLIRQIQAFQSEGIKVMVAPQISHADTENRSREWWDEYWREMERFLVYYAMLSEQVGADAFMPHYMLTGLSRSYSQEIVALEQTAWTEIFSSVKEVYSGEIGQMLMVWNMGDGLSPEFEFITWGDQVDFFTVFTNAVLSEESNPTQAELIESAATILDQTSGIYERYQKPVMISLGTHSIKQSWRATYSYPLGTCGEEKSDLECPYDFSAYDQARVIHAFIEAIRMRPWVIGLTQFGYGLWELPLIREWNIRGKTAERVWQKWNEYIYSLP